MGVLDWLSPGKQVADLVTNTVEGVGKTLQDLGVISLNEEQKAAVFAKVNEVILTHNEQAIKAYEIEIKDLNSARQMASNMLQDAPKWIKGFAAMVTPIGGVGALTVFFGNILAGWTNWFTRIPLTSQEDLTIQIIIGFFFSYRFVSKLTGIAGKF